MSSQAKQFHQEFDETLSDLITPTSKRQATAALLGKLIVQIGIFYQDTSDISQQMVRSLALTCVLFSWKKYQLSLSKVASNEICVLIMCSVAYVDLLV